MNQIRDYIRKIKHDLDDVMLTDDFIFSRELQTIDGLKSYDDPETLKRLDRLHNKVAQAKVRFLKRSHSIPSVQYPPLLPITGKHRAIIDAIKKNQIVIITGETGSGKTTQIPKMCLAAGQGRRGLIGLTQPRRIAAVSIAQRLAAELGEPCGQSVAYKIRFEEKSSPGSLIKVMTDGILLAETVSNRNLLTYDTIIVDEAHERSLNIDFILGYLRLLLLRRKDLKLIITSATMDTAKFSKAFHDAPIIEVSGRMYPVEMRYQPVDPVKEEKGEITYIDQTVLCVENLQKERRYDDILIFLPTEQDIHEVCELLSKRCSGLILPLYARLPSSQQRQVFASAGEQKIIVATNIAETSLTLPGIKYVIDAGLARILEYNPRSQTTGLPVKSISMSSADQRKGRCGRVQNGICIRLYSQDDFLSRPLYTPPEIMRSNLAGVILRMLSLKLGQVTSFPFIDPPQPRQVRDGLDILRELGALNKDDSSDKNNEYSLSPRGRTMAQFPLDPRISRILIEAQKEDCIREIAIIAAALSIQDPRERPYDKTDQSSAAHALFQHPESDFLTYLNIWNQYHHSLESLRTQNKLRKFCREHFLSYKRMMEWRDIYLQILDILGDGTPSTKTKNNTRIEINQDLADKIHRCILSGYLSNIAQKKEKNFYLAAKSRDVMIYPGSGLFNRGGSWIVAAEISQTSRVFARNTANIKTEWLEDLGKDQCRYTYAAAHWEKNRGQVVALEKVTLFGLTIVEKRSVAYERINPEEAKSIFIREALVTGEVARKIPFLEYNLSLMEEVVSMEEKLRKRGIAADTEHIANLYDRRLPLLSDIRSLLHLIKERGSDDFLRFRKEELIVDEPDPLEVAQFPDTIKMGDASLSCHYRFAPGKSDDGVSVSIPVGFITQASQENIESYLPSLLEEKTACLLKSLPRQIKQRLPSPAETAKLLMADKSFLNQPLPQALSQLVQNKFKIKIPLNHWSYEKLPDHLHVRYTVTDEKGKEIKSGRDIESLREELSDQVNLKTLNAIRPLWEKENIVRWDFGDLPEKIPLQSQYGLIGYAYPALEPNGNFLNIRLFSDLKESESVHRFGVSALYAIHFADKLKQLKKNMTLSGPLKLSAGNMGSPKLLEQSMLKRVQMDLFSKRLRTQHDFLHYADTVSAKILPYGQKVLDSCLPVIESYSNAYSVLQQLLTKNMNNKPMSKFLQSTRAELQKLVPVNFPEGDDWGKMKDLPRYIKALAIRAERGSLNLSAAQSKLQMIELYSTQLQELQIGILSNTSEDRKRKIEEFAAMIEEYKVSLFAQELKTPYPVSPKKLKEIIEEIHSII